MGTSAAGRAGVSRGRCARRAVHNLAATGPQTRRAAAPSRGVREEQLGEHSAGVWTLADAASAGIGSDAVAWRVRQGRWQRVRPGIFCDGGIVPSPRMRAWAAVLAGGGRGKAWSTSRTTLRLLNLPLIDDEDTSTGARDEPHDDVRVLRRLRGTPTLHPGRRRVLPLDVGQYGPCPSVSLPVALLHATAVLSHEALVCALDAALHRGLLDAAVLGELLARYGPVPGSATLRRAVNAADARAESPLETLGRLALLPVLPDLEPQVRIRGSSGLVIARVDLGDRRRRLAVEGDGRSAHRAMAADDHRRDRRIGAYGWQTERYTWADVRPDPGRLRRRVVAAAAAIDAARGTSAA